VAKKKIKEDVSTEEKIKQAARKLFTEKGFDAVKTRDIADEAGINQALLNYYFRSKQKLFDIIMTENFEQFIQQLIPIMSSQDLPLEDVLGEVVASYIDMFKRNPDLPIFVMNQMRSESTTHSDIRSRMKLVRDAFLKRIGDNLIDRKLTSSDTGHLMMNFMGMIIFPFFAQPVMIGINKFSQKEFDSMMEERKKLIPIWLKAMMLATAR